MTRPRLNLTAPLARWEGYAMALVFVLVVWQFGHYLDGRRALSETKTQAQITLANHNAEQLQKANNKLQATAQRQKATNRDNRHLRNAVCIIFDGVPAPPEGTEFGKLWRHAQREAQCGKRHHHKPKPPPVPPATTPTYIPSPGVTPHPTRSHHPSPGHPKHHRPKPTPQPTCVLPTSMLIKCVPPPNLGRSKAQTA